MKLPALSQQTTAIERASGREAFAFFMEQGTGKSYVALAEAETFFRSGLITQLAIIAPNGVQRNWLQREVPKLLTTEHLSLLWSPNHTAKFRALANNYASPINRHLLRIVAFNVEAFSIRKGKAEQFLAKLMALRPTLLVVDESSTIKTPTAQRTKNILRLSKLARVRRILTGTPITQSPLNFYSQFHFLDPAILGFDTFTGFKLSLIHI